MKWMDQGEADDQSKDLTQSKAGSVTGKGGETLKAGQAQSEGTLNGQRGLSKGRYWAWSSVKIKSEFRDRVAVHTEQGTDSPGMDDDHREMTQGVAEWNLGPQQHMETRVRKITKGGQEKVTENSKEGKGFIEGTDSRGKE